MSTCPGSAISLFFSGGLDSTVLAVLACASLSALHRSSTLDLHTIQFRDGSPDRVAALLSYRETLRLKPENVEVRLCTVDTDYKEIR